MKSKILTPLAKITGPFLLLGYVPVYAYIGPGAGLTAIGSFIALVVAILVAIVGFLWFPIKRLIKKYSNNSEPADAETKTDTESIKESSNSIDDD